MMFTRDGDCYVLYNGAPGVQGDKGAKGDAGEHGAPGLSAYQVSSQRATPERWPPSCSHHRPQGRSGHPGPARMATLNAQWACPASSPTEEWLAVETPARSPTSCTRSLAAHPDKGDKGATGSAGAAGRGVGLPGALARGLGSVADFVHRRSARRGRRASRGATGRDRPTGTADLHPAHAVCVILKGQSAHLGVGAECNGHEQIQVYVPAS